MSQRRKDLKAARQRKKLVHTVVSAVALVAVVGVAAAALLAPPAPPAPAEVHAVVGQPAPDFTFTAMNGTRLNLSSFRGQPVVLWWIATFCDSCQQGTRLFAQDYLAQYKARGVQMLQVRSNPNLLRGGPDLPEYAARFGYVSDPRWVLGEASELGTLDYNWNAYLDYYDAIDAQGVVRAAAPGLPGQFDTALRQAEGA